MPARSASDWIDPSTTISSSPYDIRGTATCLTGTPAETVTTVLSIVVIMHWISPLTRPALRAVISSMILTSISMFSAMPFSLAMNQGP